MENKEETLPSDVELVSETIIECGDDVTSLSSNTFVIEECVSGALTSIL